MIAVAVAGIAGRMGSRIAQLVCEADDMKLVGGWERPNHGAVGKPVKHLSRQQMLILWFPVMPLK